MWYVVASVLLVAGCAGDATAPSASTFAPAAAAKSLIDAADGTYVFTIDPSQSQSLRIGKSRLDIPAGAICDLASSGYGPELWHSSCRSERRPLTITASVSGAGTDHPRIDFQPALRFSPEADVELFVYVDDAATDGEGEGWEILYCPTSGQAACIDEARSDRRLSAHVEGQHVRREIKHFSGYVVAERGLR